MKVIVLFHQSGQDDDVIVDVIGVYAIPKVAISAFNTYLDALEAAWRIGSPEIQVFNRFSEQTGNILTYASCNDHSVWAIEEEVQ